MSSSVPWEASKLSKNTSRWSQGVDQLLCEIGFLKRVGEKAGKTNRCLVGEKLSA